MEQEESNNEHITRFLRVSKGDGVNMGCAVTELEFFSVKCLLIFCEM